MDEPKLSKHAAAARGWIEKKPGALAVPLSARKGSPPHAVMYKVAGKIFAILSLRGSEFVMRLPKSKLDLASPARRTESSTLRSDTSGSGARILVVDDNEDAADMLALALRLAGCEVHVAHDGPHALRIGAAHRFDVALLDIGLPVMDGYELARHLRNLPNLRNTQLVAVTGYGQESDRSRALAAGFQEHLVKPVDLDALVTVVNRLPRDGER